MPPKGGTRNKAKLTYNFNKYTPQGLTTLTEKELKKEYSRLRSIARKRLDRMGQSEYADSATYKYNKDRYTPLSQIKTEAQLRHKLSDLAKFITSDRGSISGQNQIRDKAIKTFKSHGYDFVNKDNYKEVVEFLDYARSINQAFAKSSEQVLDYFDMLQEEGADMASMKKALAKFSRSREPLAPVQNQRKRDSSQFRRSRE